MKIEQVKQAIETTPKGANIIVEWSRDCKTRKGVPESVTKNVRMVGRVGIEYDNMAVVQEKRETGELPSENNGLPWGHFEVYPYLIEHKGQRYVRLYKGTSDKIRPKVTFFKNGIEATKDEVTPLLLKSEITEKKGDCFCVNVEAVTRLHTEIEIEPIEAERIAVEDGVAEPV